MKEEGRKGGKERGGRDGGREGKKEVKTTSTYTHFSPIHNFVDCIVCEVEFHQ